MDYVVGGAIAAVLVLAYAGWLSARIGRLQARVVAARGALDAQLARRALAATRLAEVQRTTVPDAAVTVHAAATACLTGDADQREALENDLTRAITRLDLASADPAVTELATESRRVTVARQLHNDAVRDTLDLRHRRLPRALRLGARHPRPAYFDIAEFWLAERPSAAVTAHHPAAHLPAAHLPAAHLPAAHLPAAHLPAARNGADSVPDVL